MELFHKCWKASLHGMGFSLVLLASLCLAHVLTYLQKFVPGISTDIALLLMKESMVPFMLGYSISLWLLFSFCSLFICLSLIKVLRKV